jgi:hypothetical protein
LFRRQEEARVPVNLAPSGSVAARRTPREESR